MLICIFFEVRMKKSIYWWISLVVAAVFGVFVGFYIKEWPQFMFSAFLLMSYGVCCSLDAIQKNKT